MNCLHDPSCPSTTEHHHHHHLQREMTSLWKRTQRPDVSVTSFPIRPTFQPAALLASGQTETCTRSADGNSQRWLVCHSSAYCVSKNVQPLTCYNLDIHGSITIIFGVNVTEKVGNQIYFIFPPQLTSASATHGKQETRKLRLFT